MWRAGRVAFVAGVLVGCSTTPPGAAGAGGASAGGGAGFAGSGAGAAGTGPAAGAAGTTSASGAAGSGVGSGEAGAGRGGAGGPATGGGAAAGSGTAGGTRGAVAGGSGERGGSGLSATGGRGGGAGGAAGAAGGAAGAGPSGTPIVLSEDGGWCWFQGPRALFFGSRLVVGALSSGYSNAGIRGNVRALVHDLSTSKTTIIELHPQLELEDHDSPAFLIRPDGRLLALYGKHDSENHFYYRVSQAADGLTWGAEQTYVPTSGTSLTYSNLFLLTGESNRVYDFYRGLDGSFKPSYAYSDDAGQTWKSGNVVINVPSTTTLQRPYVRYASNGTDTIHLVYTEAHPRDFDTSLYHVYYRAGALYRSDGTRIAALSEGLDMPAQGTRIYQADSQHVAWGSDAVLDAQARLVITYSVQMSSAGLPTGQGGDDIRYRYARWDGAAWRDYSLAYAGSRLYSGEDDYSGLATLDPNDPAVVYIST